MKQVIINVLAVIGAISILIIPIFMWNDSATAMVRLNGAYSAIIIMFSLWILNKENE